MIISHYGSELLIVCHHPAKFLGHSHYGSGDVMVLICHVITQDHVITGSCDFGKESFKASHQLAKFGGHRRYKRQSC